MRSKLEEKHDIQVTLWSDIGELVEENENEKSKRSDGNIGGIGVDGKREDLELRQRTKELENGKGR